MNLFSKISFSKFHYLNLLLALFPFSFIAGNMIININILLIVFSTVILFQKELFKIKFFILDKLIFLFFFLIIFTGLFNDYNLWSEKDWKGSFPTLIKSIFFFKVFIILSCIKIFN